ncbi:MAG: sigma-70 family RNA polymerase sigma factor [Anaerolineae bacterium]|nr:sigma-70 family RNA polymerase sigma factor [Anaerolineae bacterium]
MRYAQGEGDLGPEETEAQNLVLQAQGGDRRAFGELIRLHRDGVVNVVYRLCGDAMLAEDAAQECFIRAWQNLDSYRPRSAFRNWLYRIASNYALTELRRERPTTDIEHASLGARQAGPEATVEDRERASVVQAAVLALPEASRIALVLREYEGLSYREIAETLDIPIGTVMSRLDYARGQLRKTLASYVEIGA